jgi:hypothetical protein
MKDWIKSKAKSEKKKYSFKYLKFTLPKLTKRKTLKLPFKINWKLPSFKLGAKPKKMMAIGYSAVVIGFVMTMFLVVSGTDDTPHFPDAADYYTKLQLSSGAEILANGQQPEIATQTLNLIIGDSRIDKIYLEDLEIGKESGLNHTLKMFGNEGNTTNYLECQTLIIDGLVAPKVTIGNGTAYKVIIENNVADGNSFSVATQTVSNINFGGVRGALTIPKVEGSDYDRILIDMTDGNTTCGTFTIKDVKMFGAPMELNHFKVGKLIINNSVIGDGTGINSASFIIESSLKSSNITYSNNVEQPISVQ